MLPIDMTPAAAKPRATRKLKATPGENKISEEAFMRGQKLVRLLDANEYPIPDFIRDSGISKAGVWSYINGELDIANMRLRTLEKFLGALNVSDTWAWAYFDIPKAKRKEWRTFRRPPLGHGEDERELIDLVVDMPMQGDVSVVPGYVISIDPANKIVGLMVVKLSDRYLTVPADLAPEQGEVLGQLVATNTSYRRDIPVQAPARQLS